MVATTLYYITLSRHNGFLHHALTSFHRIVTLTIDITPPRILAFVVIRTSSPTLFSNHSVPSVFPGCIHRAIPVASFSIRHCYRNEHLSSERQGTLNQSVAGPCPEYKRVM